jgi:transcriptional regulator with XRE-family HTH domain
MFDNITIKDVKTDLGQWSKLMRKKHDLTQDQLAERLNLSRITIQNFESGKNVTLDTLLKVLKHFDTLEKFNQFVQEEMKNNSYESLY